MRWPIRAAEHAGVLADLVPDPDGAAVQRVYILPLGLEPGERGEALVKAGDALKLAGRIAFTHARVSLRGPDGTSSRVAPVATLARWVDTLGEGWHEHVALTLARLTAEREAFGSATLDRPRIMGVINATPDSFSDGGDHFEPDRAIEAARTMVEAGADIIDVGGESTRPGAEPVPSEEEAARVLPIVRSLARDGVTVSIDTRHADIMEAALNAGAAIVNDVTALTHDPLSLDVARRWGVPVVLMHMLGDPGTMQDAPSYDDPLLDVYDFLAERTEAVVDAGIPRERLLVDPGIGFGKTVEHNLAILNGLSLYQGLGTGVLLGVSRKSLIGRISRGEAARDRVPGSLALALDGLRQGCQMVRVHDVAETRQAIAVWQALVNAS